jgi:Amt family ammonium transporter
LAGVVCYLAVALKNRLKLDDALDVWGVHGVGGVLGCICTGLFATVLWNPAGANGLFAGGTHFFLVETLSVVLTAAYAFAFSYVALWLINKVTKVKATEAEEREGLDEALHGEAAYETI